MAAVPPDAGVGGMTPNWTLLAALEEAMFRNVGCKSGYDLYVLPISSDFGKNWRWKIKELMTRMNFSDLLIDLAWKFLRMLKAGAAQA